MRKRDVHIQLWLNEKEAEALSRNAKKCRLTVSEYLRQLAMEIEPKELPSAEIFKSIMRLQDISDRFRRYSEAASDEKSRRFYRDISDRLMQIMTETLQLMTHSGSYREEKSDGND